MLNHIVGFFVIFVLFFAYSLSSQIKSILFKSQLKVTECISGIFCILYRPDWVTYRNMKQNLPSIWSCHNRRQARPDKVERHFNRMIFYELVLWHQAAIYCSKLKRDSVGVAWPTTDPKVRSSNPTASKTNFDILLSYTLTLTQSVGTYLRVSNLLNSGRQGSRQNWQAEVQQANGQESLPSPIVSQL